MKKIALIIGNAAYPESPLANPVNDAEAMGEKLMHLSFETIVHTDTTNKAMEAALADFATKLAACDVAFFFFAGHGMQIDGKNYLTAINTNFAREIDAKYSSLPLDKVIETMERGGSRTNIIMLDACRTNPYERKWRGIDSHGLAPVYAPKGMIIGYATSPGQVAYDGDGRNGAYTDAFLRHVSTPDITVEDLFKRVRNTLSSSTRGHQISWEHTSLMGDFYFNYSFVTEELVTEYGERAIVDTDYQPTSSDEARMIIGGLRSHNWYKQNPAIKKISGSNLNKFTKDDLFVLGRNIYQAACGTAADAVSYLENLQDRLSSLDKSISFHVFNGILFEIYFNSRGGLRDLPKSIMIDAVFQIEATEIFKDSFRFIKQALTPYLKNLFYIPSSAKGISVDVSCIDYEQDMKVVDAVFFEGDNVLCDNTGKGYFDPTKDKFLLKVSREEIKSTLSQVLIVPSYRLKVNFVNLPNNIDTVLAPYRMNIKRLVG
jgi:hypothetical protein